MDDHDACRPKLPVLAKQDTPSKPRNAATIGEIIAARYNRRQALAGLATVAALGGLWPLVAYGREAGFAPRPSRLTFTEVPHGNTETHVVAEGYRAQTLIRWGDPVEAGAPPFDPLKQTAAAQAKQWGYNNDFIAWMPLPAGSTSAGRGLLCVNFEYTEAHMMFPGLKAGEVDKVTKQQVDTELAAHGHGVVEIRRDDGTGTWSVVGANCAGGKTPWGTVLIA